MGVPEALRRATQSGPLSLYYGVRVRRGWIVRGLKPAREMVTKLNGAPKGAPFQDSDGFTANPAAGEGARPTRHVRF